MEPSMLRTYLNPHRRDFFVTAASALAFAQWNVAGGAMAAAAGSASLGENRFVDAGDLRVGYVGVGAADGPAVVLLHGWPYDIHSFIEVAPALAGAGYRVIVPYLRG